MNALNGHLYVPKKVLRDSDIKSGFQMLVSDSKRINKANENSFIYLIKRKTRGAFIIFDLEVKGNWKEHLHNLSEFVSNPMIFTSFLIKVKDLDLAFYYDLSGTNKANESGALYVSGVSIEDFRLNTAPASRITVNQI